MTSYQESHRERDVIQPTAETRHQTSLEFRCFGFAVRERSSRDCRSLWRPVLHDHNQEDTSTHTHSLPSNPKDGQKSSP